MYFFFQNFETFTLRESQFILKSVHSIETALLKDVVPGCLHWLSGCGQVFILILFYLSDAFDTNVYSILIKILRTFSGLSPTAPN